MAQSIAPAAAALVVVAPAYGDDKSQPILPLTQELAVSDTYSPHEAMSQMLPCNI